ncbi:hypothetical protein PAHAL_2G407400 [Panicum hallii]|uniref:Uncharacterized protein n=1 Tax=Panicum hallii TaxID=206008 RepID=A0A2T8KS91_9POAL|nr:hypothetical protein PAHAL_2G407400 [Panicum hallii]
MNRYPSTLAILPPPLGIFPEPRSLAIPARLRPRPLFPRARPSLPRRFSRSRTSVAYFARAPVVPPPNRRQGSSAEAPNRSSWIQSPRRRSCHVPAAASPRCVDCRPPPGGFRVISWPGVPARI